MCDKIATDVAELVDCSGIRTVGVVQLFLHDISRFTTYSQQMFFHAHEQIPAK